MKYQWEKCGALKFMLDRHRASKTQKIKDYCVVDGDADI
jgi:hypothetical protein